MKKCYEFRNCGMDKKSPQESSCSVFASGMDCWSYDWESFWKKMATGPEREKGGKEMLACCSSCPVKEVHQEEVSLFMSKIEKM